MSASVGGRQLASTNVTAFAEASRAVAGGCALGDSLQATASAAAIHGNVRRSTVLRGASVIGVIPLSTRSNMRPNRRLRMVAAKFGEANSNRAAESIATTGRRGHGE